MSYKKLLTYLFAFLICCFHKAGWASEPILNQSGKGAVTNLPDISAVGNIYYRTSSNEADTDDWRQL